MKGMLKPTARYETTLAAKGAFFLYSKGMCWRTSERTRAKILSGRAGVEGAARTHLVLAVAVHAADGAAGGELAEGGADEDGHGGWGAGSGFVSRGRGLLYDGPAGRLGPPDASECASPTASHF